MLVQKSNYKNTGSGSDEERGMEHTTARRIVHFYEWVLYLGGVCFVVMGVLFLSFQAALPAILPQYPALGKLDGAFGAITGAMLMLWGAASFWIGHGFHHHHNNTRIAFIALSLILFLGALLGGFSTQTQFWLIGLLAIAQVWLFTFQREIVILFKAYSAPKPVHQAHQREA